MATFDSRIYAGIALLVLVASSLYFTVLSTDKYQEMVLPRTCLEMRGEARLCYTCLRRGMSEQFNVSGIAVRSLQPFHFVSFGEENKIDGWLVCDELVQLIDQQELLEEGVLRIEELEHVQQMVFQLGGVVGPLAVDSLWINHTVKDILLVQKTTNLQVQTPFTLSALTDDSLKNILQICNIMAIFSCSLSILLQLLRQYHNIQCSFSVLFDLSIPLIFYSTFHNNSHLLLDIDQYKTLNVLFYLTLTAINQHFKYCLPVILFMAVVGETLWMVGGELMFIGIFLIGFAGRDSVSKWTFLFCVVSVLFKIYLLLWTQPWETVPFIMGYLLLLFFSPAVNRLIRVQSQLQYRHYSSLKNLHLGTNEQMDPLQIQTI